jgi:hypothetical protein
MTTTPDGPRRRRVLFIALGVVLVLVALIVAYLAGTQRPNTVTDPATPPPTAPSCPSWPNCDDPAASSPSPTATSTSTTTTPPDVSGELADGCLGGPDPFTAMVSARPLATPDIAGAAALARTYGRWSVTYPIDPQATQSLAAVVGPDTGSFLTQTVDSLNELARKLQSSGYTEGKALPDEAAYRVQPGGTDEKVVLDQIVSRQLTRSDGRVEQTKIAMTMFLERNENGWSITGTLPPLASDPFAPSTAAPWLYYAGLC